MQYVKIEYGKLKTLIYAEIKKQAYAGIGVRTTECDDNGSMVCRILGGDPYCGRDPRMVENGKGWIKQAINELIADKRVTAWSDGSYCWLAPSNAPRRLIGAHMQASDTFGLY